MAEEVKVKKVKSNSSSKVSKKGEVEASDISKKKKTSDKDVAKKVSKSVTEKSLKDKESKNSSKNDKISKSSKNKEVKSKVDSTNKTNRSSKVKSKSGKVLEKDSSKLAKDLVNSNKTSDSNEKGKTTKKKKSPRTSSVIADLADKDFDKTGALSNIDEGKFISEILNDKFITVTKVNKETTFKESKKKLKFSGSFRLDVLDILIIIVITAIISCVFTGLVMNYQYKKINSYFGESVVNDEGVKDFLSLYSEILDNYYEEVDSKAMIKAAMSGMLSFLQDTYSIYLSEEDSGELTEMLDSSYDGVGIVIQTNVIKAIYKNSPAAVAGLKVNDEILKVNGIDITLDNYMEVSNYLKKDEDNNIVVKRDGKELSFDVKMSKVNIPTTSSTIIQSQGKNLGYIKLSSFSNLSYEDFNESLVEMEGKGIDSLIIDLRGNSGGYLKAAHDISSEFIEKDKIIYSLQQKDKVTDYKDETKNKRDYKIVVLVNNSTASAAEIMAAALHDSYGATIVGKTTYGKGKVQTLKQYNDSLVKYTSAKWLRPNGECIDGIGIVPDYEVDIQYSDSQIYDKQLDKAIEILSNN